MYFDSLVSEVDDIAFAGDEARGEPGTFWTKQFIIICAVIAGLVFLLICLSCVFICTRPTRKMKNAESYQRAVDILNKLQLEDNEARAAELKQRAHRLVDSM